MLGISADRQPTVYGTREGNGMYQDHCTAYPSKICLCSDRSIYQCFMETADLRKHGAKRQSYIPSTCLHHCSDIFIDKTYFGGAIHVFMVHVFLLTDSVLVQRP